MSGISRSRKGTLDNFYVMIQVFGFAIFLLVILTVWNNLTTQDLKDDLWDKTAEGSNIMAKADRAYDQMDNIFLFVYFGLHLGILVLVFLLRSHPIVLVGIILLGALMVIVSVPLSNVWQDVIVKDFADASADLPKTNFIIEKLPIFEVIWLFITGIVLVGLSGREGFI